MAHAELDAQCPARLPTLAASPDPTPMNCRGMELLGFASSGTVYFCVHQCSVELWRLYDTPRVSVQKKIVDLRIQLTNCNKEQIKQLREAGIIENFRATMIALRDTERLFDALEYSRKKRGLLKHALKAKSDPSERILRVEERRARRLKAKSLVCEEPKRVPIESGPQSYAYARANFSEEECALNGDTEVPVFEDWYDADRLLVAEDAVETLDIQCKHSIEVVSNDVQYVAAELDVQSINCVPIHRMEHRIILRSTSGSADHNYAHSLESPRSSESSFPSVLSPKSVANRSRLSSPAFDSSEVEEIRSTCSTYSNSLRSLSGSPKRQSTTPDRFLFLDSDSDGESEQTRSAALPLESLTGATGHRNSTLHSSQTTDLCVHSTSVTAEQASTSTRGPPTLNHRRPIVLKLRHLAQATSPSNQATLKQLVNLQSCKSLVVSVPLSVLKSCTGPANGSRNSFQKGKREVALSSFVTKKRASSRTLSSSSENSVSSDPPYSLPGAGTMARRGRGRAKQNGYTRKQSLKGRYKTGPRGRNRSKSEQVAERGPLMSPDLSNGCKARSDPKPSRRWSAVSREDHLPMDVELPWDILGTRLCHKPKGAAEGEIMGAGANCVSASCNSNENNRTHAFTGNFAARISESQSNGTSSSCVHQDDDQLSVTSSSTNSTTSSYRSRGGTSSRRSTLTGKNGLDVASTFCFEDLFSFCPPKLTVKDGELVPEKSLLVKDYDRHNIPKGHPLLKWTLGQPLKGAAVAKKITSRKRRGCKH